MAEPQVASLLSMCVPHLPPRHRTIQALWKQWTEGPIIHLRESEMHSFILPSIHSERVKVSTNSRLVSTAPQP